MNEKKDIQKDVDPMLAAGAVATVGCAFLYNKASEIEFWIYQHLMKVTGGVFLLIAGLAFLYLYRLKNKEKEQFARARALRQLRPKRKHGEYFKGGK